MRDKIQNGNPGCEATSITSEYSSAVYMHVHGVYSGLSNWWKIDFHRENFHGLLTATAKGCHATEFRRENIAIKA